MPFLRSLAAVAFALAFSPSIGLADAQQSAKDAAVKKINISGRQRMLTQRMSKAACFRHMGIGDSAHIEQLQSAHSMFDVSLQGLMSGSVPLGLTPETDPSILAELSAVTVLWQDFGPLIQTAGESGGVDAALLGEVSARNLDLLRQSNAAVQQFERVYADGVIDPDLASAVNVAGRQRMLSQRAAKEFCLIAAGIDVEANQASLAKTIKLFADSLRQLRFGDQEAGIVGPINENMEWQYETVQGLWDTYMPALQTALDSTPPRSALELVAGINNAVLSEMNVAVFMYTAKN